MAMELTPITAIGAADGRYRDKVAALAPVLSEYGLMRFRVLVECEWFRTLAGLDEVAELPALSDRQAEALHRVHEDFAPQDALRIKALETATNHDVKAVEYFVKERISAIAGLGPHTEFVHFACTSEDINNLAHGLMLQAGRAMLLVEQRIIDSIERLADAAGSLTMLARTHGQAASPTTLAKELRVFSTRLTRARRVVEAVSLRGKFNGAVGNFNAHVRSLSRHRLAGGQRGVRRRALGLDPNPLTTQIEPHDYIAELFHALMRFNQVLLDFNRDTWAYIAIDYFGQRTVAGETGSSTMPHKVNPIDFENSEGNLGIANALMAHMADKLAVSRWQRDLSDSTVLRNIGTAFAHCSIACQAALKGVSRLSINRAVIEADLDRNWEVLAEAVQTVMRKYGMAEPYERLKQATRGQRLDKESFDRLLDQLDLPAQARRELAGLTPAAYTGLAARLADKTE